MTLNQANKVNDYYKDREINEGSIFHVITYGLNSMGSHANQLNTKERWLVSSYVMQLKNK
jgi:mono/diheme cytochrome c family protein